MDKEKIMARIRKMLALAKDAGATQGERENAMRMAHATLAKYNLELAEVEAAGQKTEDRIIGAKHFYGRPWAQVCAMSIAKLYFCHYIVQTAKRADDTRHYFIGKESNVLTAGYMAEYIVESIRKESKKRMRDARAGNAYARSFAMGAAAAISRRVEEMIAETKDQKSEGTGKALVLASVYDREKEANQQLVDQRFKTREGRSGKRDFDGNGWREGAEYGQNVSLNRQVDSPEPKALLQ